MLALIVALVLSPTTEVVAPMTCDVAALETNLMRLLERNRFTDAHQVALAAAAFCPAETRARWLLADAVALAALEDGPRALEILAALEQTSSPLAARATVLRTWIAYRSRDRAELAASLRRLSGATRGRLCTLAEADALAPHDLCPALAVANPAPDDATHSALAHYEQARHTRRPWLAATLSALLPGAGQVYAGSVQGAAVAFVLNAVAIGATVELVRQEMYWTSALTGVAASIVYVGSIVNAADLARRRNDVAAASAREPLERVLVPERFNPAAGPSD